MIEYLKKAVGDLGVNIHLAIQALDGASQTWQGVSQVGWRQWRTCPKLLIFTDSPITFDFKLRFPTQIGTGDSNWLHRRYIMQAQFPPGMIFGLDCRADEGQGPGNSLSLEEYLRERGVPYEQIIAVIQYEFLRTPNYYGNSLGVHLLWPYDFTKLRRRVEDQFRKACPLESLLTVAGFLGVNIAL